jgi:hypothetical protein
MEAPPPMSTPRPTRRRTSNPRASAIVLGQPATGIIHKGVTAHLLPHRSSDHRSRYSTGQRLAIKIMVPGPTACHVTLTAVHGPKQHFTLGQLTIQDARALGYTRLDHLWRNWITNHDQTWLGRAIDNDQDTDEEIARRFQTRWADKLAWLLHFNIDHAAAPHLLAARSDELYVENPAMALRGELPALRPDEWDTHIGPKSPYRIADHLAAKRAQTWQARLAEATEHATHRGKDIRDELRRFNRLITDGKIEKAMRQLELLEQRIYPAAA